MASQSDDMSFYGQFRNRVLIATAIIIACLLGLVILTDTRHAGATTQLTLNVNEVAINQQVGGQNTAILYTTIENTHLSTGTPIPNIDALPSPSILWVNQATLATVRNISFNNFGDGKYYDILNAMQIIDVDGDNVPDLLVSLAQVAPTLQSTNNYGPSGGYKLLPIIIDYDLVLCSGVNGTLIGGKTPQAARIAAVEFNKALWIDNNFSAGQGLLTRDAVPDVVVLYNTSTTDYVEAFHCDVLNSDAAPRSAWRYSITDLCGNPDGGNLTGLTLIHATNVTHQSIVVTSNWGWSARIFIVNGTYQYYQNLNSPQDTGFDTNNDGTDEILCINQVFNNKIFKGDNITIYDLEQNSSLPNAIYIASLHPNDFISPGGCLLLPAGATNQGKQFKLIINTGGGPSNNNTYNSFILNIIIDNNGCSASGNFTNTYQIADAALVDFTHNGEFDIFCTFVDNPTGTSEAKEGKVLNGTSFKELASLASNAQYGDGQFYCIPDIGRNGQADVFVTTGTSIVSISFEQLFLFQLNTFYTILAGACIVGLITVAILAKRIWSQAHVQSQVHMKERSERKEKRPRDPMPWRIVGVFLGILIAVSAILIVFLLIQSFGQPFGSLQVQLMYTIAFVFLVFYSMIPIIAVIFNIAAPIFATSIYINLQGRLVGLQPGNHDYRVLVLDMENRKKQPLINYFNRSFLPLALAITVGLFIFRTVNPGPVPTTFVNQGVQLWVVSFEMFCILPIILTFLASTLIVPSSWLLDDAGVVYFVENLKYRAPGDISKVSDWFLKYVKAIAGLTALENYFLLFANMQFTTMQVQGGVAMNVLMIVVIIIMLIGFPFLGGFIYMFVAQIALEGKLENNKQKLYQRMAAIGIDTTPRNLRDIFPPSSRAPIEFEKMWSKHKRIHQTRFSGEEMGQDKSQEENNF